MNASQMMVGRFALAALTLCFTTSCVHAAVAIAAAETEVSKTAYDKNNRRRFATTGYKTAQIELDCKTIAARYLDGKVRAEASGCGKRATYRLVENGLYIRWQREGDVITLAHPASPLEASQEPVEETTTTALTSLPNL